MPSQLSKAGKAAAKLAAQDLLKKYKKALKASAIKVVLGLPQLEMKALGFFKGRNKTSHYRPNAFADIRRGCQTATIWIHPHMAWNDTELGGSKTLSNVPEALTAIGSVFPGERFISGHMINADFGGDHTNPGNQTVLTHAANSQHDFDDAIKAAAKKMARAVYEMYRASNAPNANTYLGQVYNNWVIKVDVTVGNQSWYDVYNADPTLQNDPNVKNQYPLDAVATQIGFTAQAANTPAVGDIAKNLQIPLDKMGEVTTALAEFSQYMDEAARFELNQAAPPGFGATDRSQVQTTTTPLTGVPKSKTSTTTPYKPKAKRQAKAVQPVTATVPCYLMPVGGTEIVLTADGDNAIGCNSEGYPWTAKRTALTDDILFYITTQRSGGQATVSREPGVKAKIEVNRTALKAKSQLSHGGTIRVYDGYATGGFYELTFEQR
jgi:hypothetical protein